MKEFTYYIPKKNEEQKKTAVVLIQDGPLIARGVAICSEKDNFNRKLGRTIAKGRAFKAFARQGSCSNNEIRRHSVSHAIPFEFKNKCEFMPELTDLEEKLLEGTI